MEYVSRVKETFEAGANAAGAWSFVAVVLSAPIAGLIAVLLGLQPYEAGAVGAVVHCVLSAVTSVLVSFKGGK